MTEMTQEEALRHAAALVAHEVKETEARCAVLGQYINDSRNKGSTSSAWHEAVRELSDLHRHRAELKRRHSLIQQAIECAVGERPAQVPLPPPSHPERRVQRQVQIQARRRR